MAHPQQVEFCTSVKQKYPHFFNNRIVLDVGALDVNGNNQYLFEDCLYIGIDLLPGKNVDFTSKGHELNLPAENIDVILSTECFEHDKFYALTLKNIIRMLKPGGLFLFSCATTGRPEHGTRRTTPEDAPFTQEFDDWGDYYKNLDESDIRCVVDIDSIFESYSFSIGKETCDLYFWGIKKGVLSTRNDYSFQIHQNSLRSDLKMQERVTANLLFDLAERSNQIGGLNDALDDRDGQISILNQALADREGHVSSLSQALGKLTGQINDLNQVLADREVRISGLNQALTAQDKKMKFITTSNSWQLTKPIRFIGRLLRGDWHVIHASLPNIPTERVSELLRQTRTLADFLVRGDFVGLKNRMEKRKVFRGTIDTQLAIKRTKDPILWGIITTQHTLFVAHIVAEQLQAHGYQVQVMIEAPQHFDNDMYVVICPQMFTKLPPGEKRITFQMEQSVSSRWFTNEYIEILQNSIAVLDYSLKNIDFLSRKGVAYPHIHYLPVGTSLTYGSAIINVDKKYDILFYGDSSSSLRRREMLNALSQRYKVQVINEAFGIKIQEEIKQARLIINLHYYENALLEMPRIQECLSLGVPVVSESAQDQDDYPELANAVIFFEQGSIVAMLTAVEMALKGPPTSQVIANSMALSKQRFTFMFDRFLIAMNYISTSHVTEMPLPLPSFIDRVALSLPETIARRNIFEAVKPINCLVFDGIRSRPGWIGCGLSYLALAQHALKHGLSRLTVMEDDVVLPHDFELRVAIVHEYLDTRCGNWDIFAGLVAALHPDAKILSYDIFKGITFVTINKMTSMVFNIYSEKVMRLLASWDPGNLDSSANTIDRFLESQSDLRIVVALPFFVEHREDVNSTLWGFRNNQYNDMIAASERSLLNMTAVRYSQEQTESIPYREVFSTR